MGALSGEGKLVVHWAKAALRRQLAKWLLGRTWNEPIVLKDGEKAGIGT